jgi:hypothetical protein
VRPATILYERPAVDVQLCTYSHTYLLARMHGTHTQLLETTGAQQAEADAVGTAAAALITSPLFDHQKQVSSKYMSSKVLLFSAVSNAALCLLSFAVYMH